MSLRRRRMTGQSSLAYCRTALTFAHFSGISAFARIENHYFINDAFMRDGQLLDSQEIDKM
jgi:proline iminopeptidase